MTLREELKIAAETAEFSIKASKTDASRHYNEGREYAYKQALALLDKYIGKEEK